MEAHTESESDKEEPGDECKKPVATKVSVCGGHHLRVRVNHLVYCARSVLTAIPVREAVVDVRRAI